jgi:transcriptional regulator with XRE-family HTH domain
LAGRNHRETERFHAAFRELGKRIAERRNENDWTQDQLAARCGMSGTGIGNIETASSQVELASLFVIARALSVPLSALLDGLDKLVPDPLIYAPPPKVSATEGDDEPDELLDQL